jgi:hypothetical protein
MQLSFNIDPVTTESGDELPQSHEVCVSLVVASTQGDSDLDEDEFDDEFDEEDFDDDFDDDFEEEEDDGYENPFEDDAGGIDDEDGCDLDDDLFGD